MIFLSNVNVVTSHWFKKEHLAIQRAVGTPVSDKCWDLYVVVEKREEWHGSAILSLAL